MTVFEEVSKILVTELALKPDMVTLEARLNEDLGADSLDATEIITALEEKFGIEIPEDEATKIARVSDIVELVSRKLQAKSISPS